MDEKIEFTYKLIEHVVNEKLYDNYWQKVDDHVFYSKIICSLCTLNEEFADMLDEEIYLLEESDEAARLGETIYGEVVLTKDVETQEMHVSLLAENCQKISINKEKKE